MVVLSLNQLNWGRLANKSAGNGVVQVMHQTVRGFFRPEGRAAGSRFQMNSNDTHMRISNTCVQYLILCATKSATIERTAGSKLWTSEHFEAYAQYLSERPFLGYALEYLKWHLQQCGQVARDSELISQLGKKLKASPAAYILENWIPGAWGKRIPGRKKERFDFRVGLLHAATRMKYPKVVEALLIAGAEVETRTSGKTPLMVAAESGDVATARVLLDRGAKFGVKDSNEQRALHLAAANGHDSVVGLLIDRGADKEAIDNKKQTAVHLAAAHGHSCALGLLVDRAADKEAKDEKNQTALHLATANGHSHVVEILIDGGADREATDNEKQTALHLAAANGRNSTIRLLIEKGANRKAEDVFGWGALHVAAWGGQEDTIQMLVQGLDANTEERDVSGWTAFHVAAMSGYDAVSQQLVEHLGAEKETDDDAGWTALHFVAALGLEDTAKLLIKTLDMNRDARNDRGETALDLANK